MVGRTSSRGCSTPQLTVLSFALLCASASNTTGMCAMETGNSANTRMQPFRPLPKSEGFNALLRFSIWLMALAILLRLVLRLFVPMAWQSEFWTGLNIPFVLPPFWMVHLLMTACVAVLAWRLGRQVVGWTLGALLVPLVVGLWLSFRPKVTPSLMTAGDNCWYHMERDVNHMIVVAVLFFEQAPSHEALERLIRERLFKLDRFRQVPVRRGRHRYWEDSTDVRLEDHLQIRPLATPSSTEFQQRVDQLSGQKLPFDRPLWHMELVPNHPDGAALIVRIHHSVADGIALVRVLLSLTDKDAVPLETVVDAAVRPDELARQRSESPLNTLWELIIALPRLLMLPDSRTLFKQPLTGCRTTAWTQPTPLAPIKALGKRYHSKINDVVLAATAGAIRRYFLQQGSSVEGVTFRVLVPVNIRPLTGPIQLGNKIGFIYVPLPIHLPTTGERLAAVKQAMDEVKGGKQAVLSYFSLSVMGTLPQGLQHLLIDTFNDNASSTMTNVPGPQELLYFAGEPIRSMVFFGPQSGKMGVGISVFSYRGQLTMGVSADKGILPDAHALTQCFQAELAEWMQATE